MRQFLFVLGFLFVSSYLNAQEKVYSLGYLLDMTNPEIEALLDDLEKEITAVVGEDAKITFSKTDRLINNFDADLALKQYNQLEQSVDIIIVFGSINNAIIAKQASFPKPTILFGFVGEDFLESSNYTSKVADNFTSIITPISYKEDLTLLKELVGCKNVGIVIEKNAINYDPITSVMNQLSQDLELNLELVPFETAQDIINGVDGYDAVYFVGGYYLTNEEVKTVAQALVNKKIPSFTTTPVEDVENGLLATNHDQSQKDQFFRRIALSVESFIVEDVFTEPSTLLDLERNLTINFNTAQKLDIPLKYSLIATTNFVTDGSKIDADKTYSLVEVMTEVIEENLLLQETKQNVLVAEKDAALAKSNYLPDLGVSASGLYVDPKLAEASNGQNPEFSTSGNVALSQTIFSEQANASIGIQNALLEAQKEDYNREELNTIFEAATAYFNTLVLKANYQIQTKNLDLTKRNLQIASNNYEAGQSGKSDVLRFRSELVQNMQVNIESINQLKQGFYVLNQLLNNAIDMNIDVAEAELDEDLFKEYNYQQFRDMLNDPVERKPFIKFLVQEALNNSPELKFLDYNLAATERSEQLYGPGRFLPTIALQGQYNYIFSRSGAGSTFPDFLPTPPDGYYNFGVNLSLPIFNQNKQNLNRQIAEIQKDQINLSSDSFRLQIEKNINDAVLEIINQITNIELSKVFEQTAAEVLDLTQTSYANGAVNIVQLLDAQNDYLQAQLASSNATYYYLLGTITLERYLGNFFLLQTEQERNAFLARYLEFKSNITD